MTNQEFYTEAARLVFFQECLEQGTLQKMAELAWASHIRHQSNILKDRIATARRHYAAYQTLEAAAKGRVIARVPSDKKFCKPDMHSSEWYVGGTCTRCGDID